VNNKLFRYVTATLSLAISVVGINTGGATAGRQDFTVRNETSTDIVRIYVSTSNTNDWEEDVLGKDILEAGSSTKINFNNSTQGCYHDLKAVFRDGDVLERRDLNLCELRSYTFTN
jgi:hypothetical protein